MDDLGMRELALFAGAGGGLLGSKLLGWETIGAVEIDPYAANDLRARQLDGCFDPFPIYSDVRQFNGEPWAGKVDVISGGFPCQDISTAGSRGQHLGLSGTRSGLWTEYKRVVSEVQPEWVFTENSPAIRVNGLATILQDLTSLGYDASWGNFSASDSGAPQERARFFLVARTRDYRSRRHAINLESEALDHGGAACGADGQTGSAPRLDDTRQRVGPQHAKACGVSSSGALPEGFRFPPWPNPDRNSGVDDGLARRLDRVRLTGNGQVPRVVVTAWEVLSAELV